MMLSQLLSFGHIPHLVSCAFSTIPIFPLFNLQNIIRVSDMLSSIRGQPELSPPKKVLFSWPQVCTLVGRRCARSSALSSCIIFVVYSTVQSAERVAREDSLLKFPVPSSSSHGSTD